MALASRVLEASREMQFLAISRDGARVAASRVGRDHSFLWDTRSGARLAELRGHRAEFSPDSRFVVTTNRDGTRNLFDGRTGERQETIGGFIAEPSVVAYADGIVRLHDAGSGEDRWQWRVPLEPNSDSPVELFLRGGLVLVSHTLGTRQSVLDGKTGALLHHFAAPAPPPWSYTSRWLVLSESGRLAHVDGARLVGLDARSGRPLFAAEGPFECPLAIAENGAVAAAAKQELRVFASDGSERERIGLPVIPWHLEIGDRVLAACAPDDEIRLWRL